MKRTLLLSIALMTTAITFSQSYTGFQSDNYNGVNAAFFNPANIAGSKYRLDVSLMGFNTGVSNNTASFNLSTLSKLGTGNISDALLKDGSKDKFSGMINIDALGPSAMLALNKKVSVALTTRFRTLVNAEDMDTKLIKSIEDNANNINFPFNVNSTANQKIIVNGFTDIGGSIAAVLYDGKQHVLKAGATLKYLGGVSNTFINIDNIQGTVDQDILPPNDVFLTNAKGRIALGQGGIDPGNVDMGEILKFKSNGVGADIGAVYEFYPVNNDGERKNKYKLKVGVALTDIGAIKYKKSLSQYSADYTMDVPAFNKLYLSDFADKDLNEIKNYLDNSPYFTNNSTNTDSYSVPLPATLQATVDYHILNNFYANAATQISLTDSSTNTNSFYHNSVTITPRFENKMFAVGVPFNYNALSDFNAGLTLRAGPVFVGSGSVLTAIFDNSKQADFYFGLHLGGLLSKK